MRLRTCIATVAVLAVTVTPALAQLNTQHIKGGVGLKAGSQPPPHTYVVLPLFFDYNTDDVRDAGGNQVPIAASISSVAYGAGVVYVTERKILGGHYGTQILFPVGANNRLQGTEIDQNPGAGLTDSVIQPISIGWHFKRADAITAYNIFVPTGRYEDGAKNNTGFGMWGHELQLGTTVFLDAKKRYHAASIASFDFQSKKEDSETKVGNSLFLEGGVGGDFLKGGLTAGLAYYGGWKLSDDREGQRLHLRADASLQTHQASRLTRMSLHTIDNEVGAIAILKMDPIVLAGAVGGARNSTTAMRAVSERAHSTIPASGCPVTSAFSTVVLLICGYLAMVLS